MKDYHNTKIKDIFCPQCGESLIFPDKKRETKIGEILKTKICLISKKGIYPDRVLLFTIIRSNGQIGFVELSIEPGDYSKYVSLTLYPEEEVTFIHPYCHKSLNEKGWVKILVFYENAQLWEYFLNARYGIEVTMGQKEENIVVCYGNQFKNLADYFRKEWEKIRSRR